MLNATRRLLVGTISRLARDNMQLVYDEGELQDDGTLSDIPPTMVPTRGMLIKLTAADIQRLQTGGVTIQSGYYFSLPYQVNRVPDEMRSASQRFKIIKHAVQGGVSVFVIEEMPIGNAQLEAQA